MRAVFGVHRPGEHDMSDPYETVAGPSATSRSRPARRMRSRKHSCARWARGCGGEEILDGGALRVLFVHAGPVTFELLEPRSPEHTVAQFLDARGPGLHHVSLEVAEISSERLAAAKVSGARLIDEHGRPGAARQHRCVPAPEELRRRADRALPGTGRTRALTAALRQAFTRHSRRRGSMARNSVPTRASLMNATLPPRYRSTMSRVA